MPGLLTQAITKPAQLSSGPAVSALEKYKGSKMETIVDRLADLTGAIRDEHGSFKGQLYEPGLNLSVEFKRTVDGPQPGISLAIEGRGETNEVQKSEGGGTLTRTYYKSCSLSYNLHGRNVTPLESFLAKTLSIAVPMPDQYADTIDAELQKIRPALLNGPA